MPGIDWTSEEIAIVRSHDLETACGLLPTRTRTAVLAMRSRLRVRSPKGPRRPYPDRDREMRALRERGWLLEEIGRHFGITKERVRQILARTPDQ